MKFSTLLLATFASAVSVAADLGNNSPGPDNSWSRDANVTYETITTTAITTYCPSPTEVTHGGRTYTITTATTLTITDCPCTITRPVTCSPTPSTYYITSCSPTGNNTATAAPTTIIPPPPCTTCHDNVVTPTTPAPTGTTAAAATTTQNAPVTFTGAAEVNRMRVGGVVVGMAGLVAGLVL